MEEYGNTSEFLYFDSIPKHYNITEIVLKEELYKGIGFCMEVHREPGSGFQEAIYKDALECELTESGIPFQRKKGYKISYKKIVLQRHFMQISLFTTNDP